MLGQQATLSEEQVARLRGTPEGETFVWTDGRTYRVEANEGDGRLEAISIPHGRKLRLELGEAPEPKPFITSADAQREETVSPQELRFLRSLRTGNKFYRHNKLYRVTARTRTTLSATSKDPGGPPFTVTLPEPRYGGGI